MRMMMQLFIASRTDSLLMLCDLKCHITCQSIPGDMVVAKLAI